jgi:hypothetical protein
MTTTSHMQMPQRFGLPENAVRAIQKVLVAHPEVEQAIVYGSRALGRQRPASELLLLVHTLVVLVVSGGAVPVAGVAVVAVRQKCRPQMA